MLRESLFRIVLCLLVVGCGGDDEAAGVPLAPDSPWPKFRQNARQTGATDMVPEAGGEFWVFETGKGIFSTPVVGGDGTIYVGSADRTFYALTPGGDIRWTFMADEIIDSSALLDDEGRVFFGSGDGHLYARDAQTGEALWTLEADEPPDNAFINWFEANVAIGPTGDLYVPNDNYFVYSVDRATGEVNWRFQMRDQTWSLPAVDPETGRLYIGNNNLTKLLGDNTFAINPDGTPIWSDFALGSVAASPMIARDGKIIVGSFDGFLRAYDKETGEVQWTFGTRDHIYASPGELPDGTIVQASADGTVYGLDPADGAVRWAFDTLEPIRSSPAIDGNGTIYLGSGEGRLFVINPDGTLRWSMQLIEGERNDLNGSPALGRAALYIAGESGDIFSVPYDHCLEGGASDARCNSDGMEALPESGVFLYYTDGFGGPHTEPPASTDPNQPLAYSLMVREGGDSMLALIDTESVQVTVTPEVEVSVEVSGDRKFLTIVPVEPFAPDADGNVTFRITGDYLTGLDRTGLKFEGGSKAGSFEQEHRFELTRGGPAELPLPIPENPGDETGVFELYRLAAPLPTILPSYNQIGFDSLHYLIGLVEPGVAWVVEAAPEGDDIRAVPNSAGVFPLEFQYEDGHITFINQAGFTLEALNLTLPFDYFRISARLDETGNTVGSTRAVVSTKCASIPTYGPFVQQLGFCNPTTDALHVFGASWLRPHAGGALRSAPPFGTASFAQEGNTIVVTIDGDSRQVDRNQFGILLVEADTGRPAPVVYGPNTTKESDPGGAVRRVILDGVGGLNGSYRAYLMIDAYPAARAELELRAP